MEGLVRLGFLGWMERTSIYLGWTEGTPIISGMDGEDVYPRWRGCSISGVEGSIWGMERTSGVDGGRS